MNSTEETQKPGRPGTYAKDTLWIEASLSPALSVDISGLQLCMNLESRTGEGQNATETIRFCGEFGREAGHDRMEEKTETLTGKQDSSGSHTRGGRWLNCQFLLVHPTAQESRRDPMELWKEGDTETGNECRMNIERCHKVRNWTPNMAMLRPHGLYPQQ